MHARLYLTPFAGFAQFRRQPLLINAALRLTDSPRIIRLKKKLSTDCASTSLRAWRVLTVTSEVCTATAMVNEKYRKSQ